MSDDQLKTDDQALHAYCLDWVRWCRTRRFLAPPVPSMLLARLQPRTGSGREPNGPMDADISFFNMAIHGLAESYPHEYVCFAIFYLHEATNIKAVVADMNIGRQTFYDRVKRFAKRAKVMTPAIRKIHMEHTAPEEGQAGRLAPIQKNEERDNADQ
ncbi:MULTISPECIES: hypothetical protein [Ralstonia]|uniref:Uncharacterized protein n=1 Tax=Ralstonia pickettii OR214 TaxID=1264675 RepID=R0EBZ5_RALPI|nr:MULTISPECIES: hypothetical protein [Ralstonia]ENZ79609.1 hypothetical protein OR214_00025 [Ralstonia pickettii OR214]MBL4778419.1 hypothetical protein [Ralstonia sp.]MCM3582144.1 hypothetical protein [Ralstonia pickettii]